MDRNSYAVEQRLRMIDFLLASFGYIQRQHIADYFGISIVQASADFAKYQQIAPNNIRYNKSTRRYTVTLSFKRVYA
jgi:hypothetical protein